MPDHSLPVQWYYNNQSLKLPLGPEQTPDPALSQGLQYRMLVSGRVLEVYIIRAKFSGQYRCQTRIKSSGQMLSAWIYVHTEGRHS